jgi:ribosomal protein S17E
MLMDIVIIIKTKRTNKFMIMKKLLFILLLMPVFCFAQEEMIDYTTPDSSTIKPIVANYNDVVTKTVRGNIQTYITQSGEKFSVGDTITLGPPFNRNEYTFINQNAVIQAYALTSRATGSRIKIKSLNAITKKVQAMCTHADAHTYQTFIMNFELAYQNGEVKSNQISSDEALNELKRWKDKLDLELITKEEYEAKKSELLKYIK